MFGETHMYTYKAETECELLLLDKKYFTKIFFNEFRDIGTYLYKKAAYKRECMAKIYL